MPIVRPDQDSGGGGGGGGAVNSVTAADTSVVVAGTAADPTVRTNTLDVIAADHPAAADWSNNSKKITSVADPSGAQDAATKNYVDTAINGLDWKQASLYATTAALAANVYNNGASGVGATLTGSAFGALSIDGATPSVGDRVLVKNEAAGSHNGVYTVTVVGGVATLYVLTRASDYNQAAEMAAGDAFYTIAGTANADTSWVMVTTGAITVGTTALSFVQFGGQLVTSVFARTGAVVAADGDYSGVVATHLTGATAATRYVGGTASGAPASGTFAVGDFVVDQTGKVWVCTAAGTPGTWVRGAVLADIPGFATPAIALGTAGAAGAAGTVIRSDGTIAAFDTTAPSTQAFGDAAAVGAAAFAARRDHKHAMPANPMIQTVRAQIPLDTPDASGNGYPALSTNNGFSNVRRVVPAFTKSVDGTWEGSLRIPTNYGSAGTIVLSFVANATSGAVRSRVSTAIAAVSVSEDTAYTDEAYVNTTVPATALQRFDVSFTLTTTPAANSTLNVKVTRQGTNGGDTLAVDALLWECIFQYTSA